MRRGYGAGRPAAAVFGLAAAFALGAPGATAQTLEQALAQAYQNNPTLNAQRAASRVVDEQVPQALSGFRPQVSAGADAGIVWSRTRTKAGVTTSGTVRPRGYGLTVTQDVFSGFRTVNQTRSAEAQVLGARETLRNTEQNVLFDAVTSYMDVLRDTAIVDLQRQNLEALREQLRATRDRFEVGELTRTDVAQAEARVAQAESLLSGAQAQLNASRAAFRRDIGIEPRKLVAARPVEQRLPRALDAAIAASEGQHPAIAAARYGVDAASLQVKVAEGELLPIISLEGNVSRRHDPSLGVDKTADASVFGRLTVPIYQGGGEYSRIRESKETLGQRRLEADVTRDEVRAAVVQSFGLLAASRFQVEAAQAQVNAAQIALNGVQEEYRVGQRTTLDVLNAQAELVSARSALITAERDRVVNSYSLLSAVGRLSAEQLRLRVQAYAPEVHYNQVRDSWFGVRTPDGR
ncbi:MAG: TolC family outer membrane protein [Xanthobacteraceae bacterium]